MGALPFIQNEESINIFSSLMIKLVNSSKSFDLEEKELAAFKKLLNPSSNKQILIIALNFILKYIQKFEEKITGGLSSLIEYIFQQYIINSFKTPQKLVTSYNVFLISFEIISFVSDKNILKNANFQEILLDTFNEKIFINQSVYFNKASKNDLNCLIRAIMNFSKKEAKVAFEGEDNNFYVFVNTLISALFSNNFSLGDFKIYLKKVFNDFEDKRFFFNSVINGLFYKVFFENFIENSEISKFDFLVQFIINNLELIIVKKEENGEEEEVEEDEDEEKSNCEKIDLFHILWLVYHPIANKTASFSERFMKKINKKNDLKEIFNNYLENNIRELEYFFLSNPQAIGLVFT